MYREMLSSDCFECDKDIPLKKNKKGFCMTVMIESSYNSFLEFHQCKQHCFNIRKIDFSIQHISGYSENIEYYFLK